jgi:hypothetical protein
MNCSKWIVGRFRYKLHCLFFVLKHFFYCGQVMTWCFAMFHFQDVLRASHRKSKIYMVLPLRFHDALCSLSNDRDIYVQAWSPARTYWFGVRLWVWFFVVEWVQLFRACKIGLSWQEKSLNEILMCPCTLSPEPCLFFSFLEKNNEFMITARHL